MQAVDRSAQVAAGDRFENCRRRDTRVEIIAGSGIDQQAIKGTPVRLESLAGLRRLGGIGQVAIEQ
ncbi:hypothetical protein D3C73_1618520 [compost metagenome]